MSGQFGRWHFEGKPPAPDYLERVRSTLAGFGPDGAHFFCKGGMDIVYCAFHTTRESRSESQPHVTASGAVITWDGRLDNRGDFIGQGRDTLSNASADVSIVAAAYERWGTHCFSKLVGDWALSIWNPGEGSLILAKDPLGTRPLYYAADKDQVTWSSILDPLVLLAGKSFALEEEYLAGWFSFFPAAHLTPYMGIHSVPPSSFVRFERGRQAINKYWDFDPSKSIRYRTDAEYEEHFRTVFAKSVRRRLRSDAPILAELSGGIDSSSIVCMADTIMACETTEAPRLDTVSYYDDSEPNWNERPYFTNVEERRGRIGCHIDVGTQDPFTFEFESGCFLATPGSGAHSTEAAKRFADCITSQGNRVVLSGLGGDEVLGGVPTPVPELADLLSTARFRILAHQLNAWALSKRTPWFHLLYETAREFFPPSLVGTPKHKRPAQWLHPCFVKRHGAALAGYESRLKLFGPLPSFQENVSTLDALRRQLVCNPPTSEPLYERRYPYLDRDLLEFAYAIPREQVVRPGERRSLMRRALVGIVPGELLNRKRKAFVVRAPMAAISTHWASLVEMSQHMVSSSLGIVEQAALSEVLQKARQGEEVPIVSLIRGFTVESWLRNLSHRKLLFNPLTVNHQGLVVSSINHHVQN